MARMTKGSGDVFKDIGIELTDIERTKLAFAAAITRIILRNKITQKEAAEILGADQAKISSIMRGRLKGFSIDRLIGYLVSLGGNIEITIKEARKGKIAVLPTQRARKTKLAA